MKKVLPLFHDDLELADSRLITVSGKMLRQQFHPCEADYIRTVCQGRCCQGSKGILVVVHKTEQVRIEELGAVVENGLIVPDDRGLCSFKSDEGFCKIHGREKPFGCQASPFTLNKAGTLIVRNRYRVLRCYKCEGALPAYQAHRWSLESIFGVEEALRIALLAEQGADKFTAHIGLLEYQMLIDNDLAKVKGVYA